MTTALITGASSGLGAALAARLDRRFDEVVVVARSAAGLEALCATMTHGRAVVADLATEAGVAAVLAAVDRVDLLVNNAGFGAAGPTAEADPVALHQMVALNCGALTDLTRAILPQMLERGEGQILNVASTAAFQAGPFMSVYYATKAYVLSFTEAVAEEVRGTGVTVTAFCPGAFHSGFQEVAAVEETRLVKGRKLPDAAQMADAALLALERHHVVAVPGLMNKLGAFGPRLTPRPVLRRMVRYIQSPA